MDGILGICDFALSLLCETAEYEAQWWWLYFDCFDGPTIIFTMFWDSLMFYQIFLSP